LKIGGKIPAETASFRSTTVSPVREDWMVGATGIEPVTPSMSTQRENLGLRQATETRSFNDYQLGLSDDAADPFATGR
jgi:hypothetical protein